MTDFGEISAAEPGGSAPEQKYDEETGLPVGAYSRYLLPMPPEDLSRDAPATGRVKSWTRATTISSSMEYMGNLTEWSERMVALGVGMRPDLALKARGSEGDRAVLTEVVEEAKSAAGATKGKNQGTGMHGVSSEIDRAIVTAKADGSSPWGEIERIAESVPSMYRDDVRAYARLIINEHIEYGVGLDEVIVAHPDLMVAGRFDKIRYVSGAFAIFDLKTQKDRPGKHSQLPIAMQLALYARAPWRYDTSGETPVWRSMPGVSHERAYIIWLPGGRGEATLIEVDIASAWQWVRTAISVRESRRVKGLYFPLATALPGDPVPELQVAPAPTKLEEDLPAEVPDGPTPEPATGKKGKRRCGRCGQLGHNARTCTAATEVVEEPSTEPEDVPVEGSEEPESAEVEVAKEPLSEPADVPVEEPGPAEVHPLDAWIEKFRRAESQDDLDDLYRSAVEAEVWGEELLAEAQERYLALASS